MNWVEKGFDFYNKFEGNTAKSNDRFTNAFKGYSNKIGWVSTDVFKRYSKKKQQNLSM